jgi:hypothetical protein
MRVLDLKPGQVGASVKSAGRGYDFWVLRLPGDKAVIIRHTKQPEDCWERINEAGIFNDDYELVTEI